MPKQHLLTAQGDRIAIVSGLRTPFARRDTGFKDAYATSLGTMVTNELLSRLAIDRNEIEQLVFGQVIQQPDIPNPAREIALALNMPQLQTYSGKYSVWFDFSRHCRWCRFHFQCSNQLKSSCNL